MTPIRDLLRRDQAFDRWGEEGQAPELGPTTRAMLAERIGSGEARPRVPLGSIDLPQAAAIPDSVIDAAGGHDAVSVSDERARTRGSHERLRV